MEAKPVVRLTEQLGRHRTRLLRNEHGPEIILAPFLHPFHVGAGIVQPAAENALRLLYDGDGGDYGTSARKVLLIMRENPPEKQTGEHVAGARTQQAYVDDDNLSFGQSAERSRQHLAVRVVKGPHDIEHIAASRRDFDPSAQNL